MTGTVFTAAAAGKHVIIIAYFSADVIPLVHTNIQINFQKSLVSGIREIPIPVLKNYKTSLLENYQKN